MKITCRKARDNIDRRLNTKSKKVFYYYFESSIEKKKKKKVLTTCWTSRAITESSSIGVRLFNGGTRAFRTRDDRSLLMPLDDSSASVSINFLTTVLISVVTVEFDRMAVSPADKSTRCSIVRECT